MPKYRVRSHLTHDKVEYPPDSEVTMTEEQAAAIPDAVEKIEEKIEPPAAPERERGESGDRAIPPRRDGPTRPPR